jgi:hypothetical protein
MPPQAQPRLKELLAKTLADAQRLTKAQVELAKAEIAQSGGKLGVGGGLGVAALMTAWFAVLFLLLTLALGLWQVGLQPWAAFGIVALLLIATAALTAFLARRNFEQISPPALAIAEFEKTKAALSGTASDVTTAVTDAAASIPPA